jgi:hypothetical protein
MILRCRLGHELQYAFVKSAIGYKIRTSTPCAADTLVFERRPFSENCWSIKIDLLVGLNHPYCFAFYFVAFCPADDLFSSQDSWTVFCLSFAACFEDILVAFPRRLHHWPSASRELVRRALAIRAPKPEVMTNELACPPKPTGSRGRTDPLIAGSAARGARICRSRPRS